MSDYERELWQRQIDDLAEKLERTQAQVDAILAELADMGLELTSVRDEWDA